MTIRRRISLVLTCAGLLITAVSAFLPWTWNSEHGGTSGIVSMWGLYVAVLLLQVLAVLLAFRRSAWSLLPALVAVVTVITAMVITPRGVMMWDGVDKFGRPTGGMEITTLGYGTAVALVGALVLLVAPLVAGRRSFRTPPQGRHEPGVGPSTLSESAIARDGSAAPGRE